MAQKIPLQHVQWPSTEEEEKFQKWLKQEVDDAFRDRQDLERKWVDWFKQYEGRLERSDNPASWQSKIDLSTTREHGQAVVSRLVNPLFNQDRIMTCMPRKPEWDQFSRQLEDFYDFAFDQFDAQQVFTQWIEDHVVYGLGVLKVPWVNRTRRITEWVPQPVAPPPVPYGMEMGMELGTGLSVGMPEEQQTQLVEQPREVTDEIGAIPQNIHPSNLIWPAYGTDQATLPWIGERYYQTESYVKRRIKKGEWYDCYDKLTCVDAVDDVTKAREDLAGLNPTAKRYELLELYVKYDTMGTGEDQDLIVTMDRHSGCILQNAYNFYHDFKDPYCLLYWSKRPGSMEGASLCYYLEPLHRAISAATNMQLDAASLAIKGWFILTTDQQFADLWKTQQHSLGDVIETNQLPKESTEVFALAQAPNNMSELVARLQTLAMHLSMLNAYNKGDEQVQRPTASGQALLVQEGMEPIKERLNTVRNAVARLALIIAARYRQFWQNQVEFSQYVDGQLFQGMVQFPDGLIEDKLFVEPKATSATMNEQVRRQEIIGLMDRMQQVYQMLLDMTNMAFQASMAGSPVGMVAGSFVDSMQEITNRLLREFKVTEPEKLNPPVNAVMQVAQQYTTQIQMLQQQIMQMQQAFMGGPPQGPQQMGPGPAGPPQDQGGNVLPFPGPPPQGPQPPPQ